MDRHLEKLQTEKKDPDFMKHSVEISLEDLEE